MTIDQEKLNKIRLLIISHDAGLHGAQLSLLGLLSNLDRDIFEPIVILPNEGPLKHLIEKLNIRVIQLELIKWVAKPENLRKIPWLHPTLLINDLRKRWWAIQAVKELIELERINVIYTNTVTCLEGAFAAFLARRPHIWHLREHVKNNIQIEPVLVWWLISHIVNFLSTNVIVNSKSVADTYRVFWNRKKITLVYNGIELKQFKHSRTNRHELIKELNLDQDKKLITIIGDIHPQKGHETFVHAAQITKKAITNTAYLIVGEGEKTYVELTKRLVQKTGLQSSVFFLGHRTDIEKIFSASDVLVVSAVQEAFGRTIIEAMAAGTPVVATRSGGPEEIITDGITGLLVPINAPEEMSQAILKLLKDNNFSGRIAQAANQRVKNLFSLEGSVAKIQECLMKVVDRRN